MIITNINKLPDIAGIYRFRNKINNKSYIGQSLFLRRRLKAHITKFKTVDNPLYQSIKKYGLEQFEISVLEILRGTDFRAMKKQLDILEQKYIEKFDSYKNGYNQTLGGDGGILGYKMTEEQRQKISQNGNYDPHKKTCYALNLETDEIIEKDSIQEMANFFGTVRQLIGNRLNHIYKSPFKKHIFSFKKDFSDYDINEYKNLLNDSNSNSFKEVTKYTKDEFLKLLNECLRIQPNLTIPECAQMLDVCKKTLHDYLIRFKIKSPFSDKLTREYIIVYDTIEDFYERLSVTEASVKFKIKESSVQNLANRLKEKLYKKRYKIKIKHREPFHFTEPNIPPILYKYVNENSGNEIITIYPDEKDLLRFVQSTKNWKKV